MENNTATEEQTDVIASGTTYGLRDQLKECGAQYNAAGKTWRLTPAQLARFEAIVSRVASPTGNKRAREYERAWNGITFEKVK